MTVRIGNVWDSTVEVIGGRRGMIASIALVAFFVPSILQNAIKIYGEGNMVATLLGGVVGIAVLFLTVWGQLAIIAIATDPATTRRGAGDAALRRMWPAIGVALILLLIGLLLLLPPLIAIGLSGFDVTAASTAIAAGNAAAMPALPGGTALFVGLYILGLMVLGLWASARLLLVNAVVLNERRGFGAILRSVELTRGLTWKLIGLAVLVGIVFMVALFATQAIVTIVFGLVLGSENVATSVFLASIAVAALTAAFVSVVYVFTARLYVATVAAAGSKGIDSPA